nr:hypothetical protein CFP56_79654 [Quercus suber]
MVANSAQVHEANYWLTDTGCSDHVIPELANLFLQKQPTLGTEIVTIGNDQELLVTYIGNGKLCTSSHNFKLDGKIIYEGLSKDGIYLIPASFSLSSNSSTSIAYTTSQVHQLSLAFALSSVNSTQISLWSNLINANVPFSTTISKSDWFSINSTLPSSYYTLPSSSTSHLFTSTDYFPLDILHSTMSSSYVLDPPLSSLPSSSQSSSSSVPNIFAFTSFA